MEWKEFTESPREYPEVIVEKFISGFSKATQGLAELGLETKSEFSFSSKLNTQFEFALNLFSNYINGYRFKIIDFGYDVELFPVKIIIETSILAEINQDGVSFPKVGIIETEENLNKVLELIFKTKKFDEIVGGLMKIAKKQLNDF